MSDRDGSDGTPEDHYDFRHPDIAAVVRVRSRRLQRLRERPEFLPRLREFYRSNPGQFISDWGSTFDPRGPEIGFPAVRPFVLFPKQMDWVGWVLDRWRGREDGITEKSRDSGVSWLAIALASTLCLFNEGLVIGFGSRKEEYVDKLGQPKSLFEKARIFLELLPPEFRGGWERAKHSPYMRILFPSTGSCLTGEAGDGIGRGDRTSIYFIDEAAFLERPLLVKAALSGTSNCRISISTPNGSNNPFAEDRFSGRIPVFTFHWRDDPRKDLEWYERECAKLLDPVVIAQELDISYTASREGIIIPQEHVQAAIDAHMKLAITPSGMKRGALDVADEGKDRNAFAARHGILLTHCESWSGKGSDIFATTERAARLCDDYGLEGFDFDSDGLGAGVRGDYTRIAARRKESRMRPLKVSPYRGSDKVFEPERKVPGTDVKAVDRWQNAKAQSWGALASRFYNTFRAVKGGDYDPDNLISLSSEIKELSKLCIELSQPQWKISSTGKLMVDKQPDGMSSPNLADGVCICFRPRPRPMRIADSAIELHEDY